MQRMLKISCSSNWSKLSGCYVPHGRERQSSHAWVKGSVNDIFVPIESYHLFVPFGKRIKHDTQFEYNRIPAIVKLCMQAGVDIPKYPSHQRTNPIRMLGKSK